MPRDRSCLVAVLLGALTSACADSHLAPGSDAGPPGDAAPARADAGPVPACTPGDLLVVDDLGGVRGAALGASGGSWGVTYGYGRFERFAIVDGATGGVVDAIDGAAISMMSIGTDQGFVVVYGSDAIYVDRDGSVRGELPLESRLAVGGRGFLPLEDDGERIYAWLAEPGTGAVSPARLVTLPRTPDGTVQSLPLVLDEAPLAYAVAPGGRVLVVEGDPAGAEIPRVRELVVGTSGVTDVSDASFAGGFSVIAAATWGGDDAWVVSGAFHVPDTAQLLARAARIAGGRIDALPIDDAPELSEYVASALLRGTDGSIHATFSSAYVASAVDRVTFAPDGAVRVEELGGSSSGTHPRIARGAGGCTGVLVGVGATATTSESSLMIRVRP